MDRDPSEQADVQLQVSFEHRRALYGYYAVQSSGVLQLFSAEEAQTLLVNDLLKPEPGSRREDLAAIDTALAIGAQARAASSNAGTLDAQWAAAYFSRARAIAFENMLANPSPALVRLFVLLAFYNVSTYRQIPAAIYLGIASKAAVILGLHQPMSPKVVRQGGDHAWRMSIWHSLCILDVLSSSLLGRPCTAPRATRHDIMALPLNPSQPQFNATLIAASILDDICLSLNGPEMIDAQTTHKLLARLRTWSQSLPLELRNVKCRNTTSLSQSEALLIFGNVHVSSVYYFATILVTRPFLVRHLMSGIRLRAGQTTRVPSESADRALAQVCTASAVYMGQLCRVLASMRVHDDRHPLSLPSLFKAWAFSSGLIIGFSMLADEGRPDLNDAFQGILVALDAGSDLNPQSRLYAETLRAFADTISTHQRMSFQKLPQAAESFVEQILSFESGHQEDTVFDMVMSPGAPTNNANVSLLPDGLQTDVYDFSNMDHDWANLGIQFLEPFDNDCGVGFA